ncbi:MAG: hypothetical protein QOI18_1102 [Solirubrobacteraceae bacterium]|jgi:hypothetical protein|nr:hypothetical protein [Solirubrobacteraceae bacterium]
MRHDRALPERSVHFRSRIIDALIETDARRFWYIESDIVAGACPVCGAELGVRFHGLAPRADLTCNGGCAELQVAEAIGRLAPRVEV